MIVADSIDLLVCHLSFISHIFAALLDGLKVHWANELIAWQLFLAFTRILLDCQWLEGPSILTLQHLETFWLYGRWLPQASSQGSCGPSEGAGQGDFMGMEIVWTLGILLDTIIKTIDPSSIQVIISTLYNLNYLFFMIIYYIYMIQAI